MSIREEFVEAYKEGHGRGGIRGSRFTTTNGHRIADWWITTLTEKIEEKRIDISAEVAKLKKMGASTREVLQDTEHQTGFNDALDAVISMLTK